MTWFSFFFANAFVLLLASNAASASAKIPATAPLIQKPNSIPNRNTAHTKQKKKEIFFGFKAFGLNWINEGPRVVVWLASFVPFGARVLVTLSPLLEKSYELTVFPTGSFIHYVPLDGT